MNSFNNIDDFLKSSVVKQAIGSALTGEDFLKSIEAHYATADPKTRKSVKNLAELGVKTLGRTYENQIKEAIAAANGVGLTEYDIVLDNQNNISVTFWRKEDESKKLEKNFRENLPKLDFKIGRGGVTTKSGLPSVSSFSIQKTSLGAIFSEASLDVAEAGKQALLKLGQQKQQGREFSYQEISRSLSRAAKEAEKSFIALEDHVDFDDDEFERDRRALNKQREYYTKTNLRLGGFINKIVKETGLLQHEMTKGGFHPKDQKARQDLTNRLSNEVFNYIAVASQYGKEVAQFQLTSLLEDKAIASFVEKINQELGDVLNIATTMGLGSDEALRTKTLSTQALLTKPHEFLDVTSRHNIQTLLYEKRRKGTKGAKTSPIRVKQAMDLGFDYDVPEQELMRIGMVSSKELTQKIKELFPDYELPSIEEDMSIISASAAKARTTERQKTKRISAADATSYKEMAKKTKGYERAKNKEEYIDRFIAEHVLNNFKKLVDIELSEIADTGEIEIKATDVRSWGQMSKGLIENLGIRSNMMVVPDKIMKAVAESLGLGEKVQLITQAKEFSANELPGIVHNLMSEYVLKAQEVGNEYMREKLLEAFGSDWASFDEKGNLIIDESFEKRQGIDLRKKIEFLTKQGLLKEDAGTYTLANKSFLDIVNMASGYDYQQDVKISQREVQSMQRAMKDVGISKDSAFAKIYKEQFAPQNKKAEENIKKIDKALEETYSSQKVSLEDLKKEGDVITIGLGQEADINLADLADVQKEYEEGRIPEEVFQKLIWGRIEAEKQRRNLEAARIVLDPGAQFGIGREKFGSDTSEVFKGRYLFLPDISPDELKNLQEETVYNLPEYDPEISRLISTILRGGKKDDISASVADVAGALRRTAHYKEGKFYRETHEKRVGGSASTKVMGIAQTAIDELKQQLSALDPNSEEAKRLQKEIQAKTSAIFIGPDLAKEILSDKSLFRTEDGEVDEKAYYSALSEAYQQVTGEEAGDMAVKDLIASIIEQARLGKSGKGLLAFINRYPSISGQDVKTTELFIDEKMKGVDYARVGVGLWKLVNGDFDGDTLNFILAMLKGDKKAVQTAYQEASALVQHTQRESELMTGFSPLKQVTTPRGFSEDILKNVEEKAGRGISSIATEINKPFTGVFSNISSRIREVVTEGGISSIDQDSIKDKNKLSQWIQGRLAMTATQALEQDAISSKKVEERILAEIQQKINNGEEISQETIAEIAKKRLTEYSQFLNKLLHGDVTNEEFIEQLSQFGVLKEGKLDSQVSKSAVANIMATLEAAGYSTEDISNILFPYGIDIKTGTISREGLAGGLKASEAFLSQAGRPLYNKGGFFKKGEQPWQMSTVISRDFLQGTKDDFLELTKFLKSQGVPFEELETTAREAYNSIGRAADEAKKHVEAEALAEQNKVGIASKEAKAIDGTKNAYDRLSDSVGNVTLDYEKLKDKSAWGTKSTQDFWGSEFLKWLNIQKEHREESVSSLLDEFFPYQGKPIVPEATGKIFKSKTREEALKIGQRYNLTEEDVDRILQGEISRVGGQYGHAIQEKGKYRSRKERRSLEKLINLLPEDQQANIIEGYENVSKSVTDVAKSFGKKIADEIPFAFETASGTIINGRIDSLRTAIEHRQTSAGTGYKQQVGTIIDYKFEKDGAPPSPRYIAQLALYGKAMKGLSEWVQSEKGLQLKAGVTEENIDYQAIVDKYKNMVSLGQRSADNARQILGMNISTETLKQIGLTKEWKAVDIVADLGKNIAQGYKIDIGNIPDFVLEAIEGGGLEDISSRSQISGYLKRFVSPILGATAGDLQKVQELKQQEEERKKQEELNDKVKDYKDLLKEIVTLKKQLLDTKLDEEETELKKAIETRETQRLDLEKEINGFGDNGTSALSIAGFSAKASEEKIASQAIKGYEKVRRKQMSIETEIYSLEGQKRLASTEKEKDAIETLIRINQKRLTYAKDEVGQAEKKVEYFAKGNEEAQEELKTTQAILDLEEEKGKKKSDASRHGMTNIWDNISRQMGLSFQRFVEYGVLYKAQAFLQQSIQKIIQLTQEYDQTLMNLRIVTGYSKNEATTLMHTYSDLAEQLGSTTKAVAASAEGWLRQGYSISEANDLIKASTYLSTLGQMSAEDATRSLTSALKGFKLEATSVMQVVDELTALDMNFATSAKSIAESLSVVASVANSAGLSLETTSAMLTTIMDVTQQTGSEAGNALKTILSRYGTVKGGSFTSLMGDEEDVKNLNDVEKVLNSIGITIRNSTMEFRDFGEVMDDLNDKWISLTTVERNAVATAMAGTRQRNAFLSLMDNYSKYQDALRISEGASGTAEEKYEAVVDSLSYAVNKLTTAWEKLAQTMNLNPVFKWLTDTTALLLEHLPKIITYFSTMIAVANAYKIPTLLKNFTEAFSPIRLLGLKGITAEGRMAQSLGISQEVVNPIVNKLDKIEEAIYEIGGYTSSGTPKEEIKKNIKEYLSASSLGLTKEKRNVRLREITQSLQDYYYTSEEAKAEHVPFENMAYRRFQNEQRAKELIDLSKDPKKLEEYKELVDAVNSQNIMMGRTNISGLDFSKNKQGKWVSSKGTLASPEVSEMLDQAEANREINTQNTAISMTAGGITGALGGALSYGDWSTTGGLMRKGAGTAIGALSGVLMGTGNPYLMAASAALSLIGPFVVQFIKSQEEERKERVEEARKRLSALEGMSSTISSTLTSAMKSIQDRTAEDYMQMRDSYKELSDALYSYQKDEEKVSWSFYEDFQEALGDLGYATTDVDSAMQELANGTDEASKVMQAYSLAQRRRMALETELAQEDQRASINKKISEAKTEEEREKYRTQLKNYERDVREQYLQVSLISSGLSAMSSLQLGQYSLNAVIEEIASKWAQERPQAESFIFDYRGQVTDEARKEIESALRADSSYSSLFKNGSLTYGQMGQAFDIAKNLTKGRSYEELRASEEFAKYTNLQLRTLVDQATQGEKTMSNFAHSLGLTRKQAQGLADSIKNLTSEDALAGLDGAIQRYETLGNIFESLSKSSKISQENLDKIISSFPWLLFGQGGKISQENVLPNLVDLIMGSGEIPTYFASQVVQDAMTDPAIYDLYKKSLQESGAWEGMDISTQGRITAAQTYKEIQDILDEIEEQTMSIGGASQTWEEAVRASYSSLEIYNQLLGPVYEYENMMIDEEIKNIQSLKDALGSVNNLREKELKLIKAKQAVEEAKEEKQLVYRAGLGWQYVTNVSAVAEAQENLENLQLELEQDNLQYQIDQLNTQKEILNSLQNKDQYDQLVKIGDLIGEKAGGGLFGWLTGGAENNFSVAIETSVSAAIGSQKSKTAEEDVDKLQEFEETQQKYQDYISSEDYEKAMSQGGVAASVAKSEANQLLSAAQTAGELVAKTDYSSKEHQEALQSEGYSPTQASGIVSEAQQIQKEQPLREDMKIYSKGLLDGKDLVAYFSNRDLSAAGLSPYAPDELAEQFTNYPGKMRIARYNSSSESYSPLTKEGSENKTDITQLPDYSLVVNTDGVDYAGIIYKGTLYKVGAQGSWFNHLGLSDATYNDIVRGLLPSGVYYHNNPGYKEVDINAIKKAGYAYASGTLDFIPNALINENGSEAVVTPYGTLTALPAHSGIVPADLTSNLYDLGEIAPNLIGTLSSLKGDVFGNPFTATEDNSMNINNLNASFNITEDFDIDQFLTKVKSYVAISRNNR